MALGITTAFTDFLAGEICMIQNEVHDSKLSLSDNYIASICEIRQWSHSAHGGPADIRTISFCETPLPAGQEEQKKTYN